MLWEIRQNNTKSKNHGVRTESTEPLGREYTRMDANLTTKPKFHTEIQRSGATAKKPKFAADFREMHVDQKPKNHWAANQRERTRI